MPRLSFIEKLALPAVSVAVGVIVALGARPLALGVAAGGLLFTANVYLLRALMVALVASAARPPRQLWLGLLMLLKFAGLGLLIFGLVVYGRVEPAGLLGGISLVVLCILAEGARTAARALAPQPNDSR